MQSYENNEDIDEDSSDLDRPSLNPESNLDLLTDDSVTANMSSNDTKYCYCCYEGLKLWTLKVKTMHNAIVYSTPSRVLLSANIYLVYKCKVFAKNFRFVCIGYFMCVVFDKENYSLNSPKQV